MSLECYVCFNIISLIVSLYNAFLNNGRAKQQARKIPKNLTVRSHRLVQATSNTPLNVSFCFATFNV